MPQVTIDAPNATLTFTGPSDAVTLTQWILPQIDRATGDTGVHEYPLPAGEIARVRFIANAQSPQQTQEFLTIIRTVDDVQKIFNFTSNHAIIMRAPDWKIAFAEWIIDQLDQPANQKPDTTPREFTVGGPDFHGQGHGARLNFLANVSTVFEMQQVLSVLRSVGEIQKVFNYSSSHALVFRGSDADLDRAEWLIQQFDIPAGQASGNKTYTSPAGDDVTKVFYLSNATAQGLQTAVTGLRSDLKLRQVFATTKPAAAIIIRGKTDQVAAASAWLASRNALAE